MEEDKRKKKKERNKKTKEKKKKEGRRPNKFIYEEANKEERFSNLRKEKELNFRLKALRNQNKYNSYLKKEGVYSVSPKLNFNSGVMETGAILNYYKDLIKNKRLKDDETLMNDVIKFRKQIIQHRLSCQINLHSKGEFVAGVRIYSVLIENAYEMYSFWIGKTIDPSSFKILVYAFGQQMSKHGGISAKVTTFPIKTHKIDDVNFSFTFS